MAVDDQDGSMGGMTDVRASHNQAEGATAVRNENQGVSESLDEKLRKSPEQPHA